MNGFQEKTAEILKKIRTLEIKTKGLVETVFAGDYHSVFKGRGMNFEDVREYQPGDEIRAIDCNVTARLGTAFVKKCTEEREPAGRGTDPALALDYLNKVVTRRAVVFFISDFQAPDFSHTLAVSGRRHDFIAVHIQDEREQVLPNVGIITLEDAETGEQIEINTADRGTRTRFSDLADEKADELSRTLRRNNIDAITLRTSEDYLPALRSFFKLRERRVATR